ncbi:MAG TPA: ATP-binding protein [Steroidobacteraceae bacterium]|nr:ATP-binding protein [Steroidobacteraceae bacterium]
MHAATESFSARQLAVLERVAAGAPLPELLRDIVDLVESQAAGMMCSILLLDENQRLRNGAFRSLPAAYQRAIEGELIGPTAGSCGAAAFLAKRIIVTDIETHPNWERYRTTALPHGLRACWSTPICSPDGKVLGTFAIYYREVRAPNDAEIAWVDVASHLASIAILRHRSEEAVRTGENLLSMIFGSVQDAIIYLSVEGPRRYRIIAANRALLTLTHLEESKVVGRLLEEAAADAARPVLMEKYEQARSSGQRVTWEETHRSITGTRHSHITLGPILDADGRCTNMVCTVHDITALKNAEAEHVRLERKLHQAQRLQSLGTMAGGIAHDFNNIIAAISSNVDLALLDDVAHGQVRKHLFEVQKAASRAKHLVRQILTFSHREPPARELFDPLPTVEEALLLLNATLPQHVQLETRLDATIPTLCGDPTQLHQLVMNLGTNAARAIGQQPGIIEVMLSAVDLSEGTPRLERLRAGRYVRLCVRDTGCGMDAATLQCAFDPFFTTRPMGEGTGLGLSVVHGIVEGHGGAIDVESERGKGTSFSVYLPVYAPAVNAKVLGEVNSAQAATVLYVDDDEALVFLATRALTRLGYHVVGYLDPSAAVEDFRAHPNDFDVVITDVSMPQLSGSQFAAELLQIRPNIPIVMMTGHVRPEDQEAARRLRINDVVRKPSTLEEFAQMLARCMENPQSGGVKTPS